MIDSLKYHKIYSYGSFETGTGMHIFTRPLGGKSLVKMLIACSPWKNEPCWTITYHLVRLPESSGFFKPEMNGSHIYFTKTEF